MKWTGVMGCVLLVAALTSCATSYVLVGKRRTPTSPDSVQLLVEAPAKYESIALLETSDLGALCFTMQCRTNKVVDRLKDQAAKLGANAILFEGMNEQYAGSIGTGIATGSFNGNSAYSTGVGMSTARTSKHGKAIAIFVEK